LIYTYISSIHPFDSFDPPIHLYLTIHPFEQSIHPFINPSIHLIYQSVWTLHTSYIIISSTSLNLVTPFVLKHITSSFP